MKSYSTMNGFLCALCDSVVIFGQNPLQAKVVWLGLTKEDPGIFVFAVHPAQVEIVDAAKIAGKVEILGPAQPPCQRLQIDAILTLVIALAHALFKFPARVSP